MSVFSVLVKPSSSKCNLKCKYCFYRKETEGMQQLDLMKEETVRKLIDSLNSYTKPGDVISIRFQGGEPTLMGLEFYRKWIGIEAGYPERNYSHSIQTNGICIDKEWAEFFQKNRFLVGISVDGYEELHDRYRKDVNGFGTFEKNRVSTFCKIIR